MKVRLSNASGTIEVEGTQDEVAAILDNASPDILHTSSLSLHPALPSVAPWCTECNSRHGSDAGHAKRPS